mmetsp:Transcript_40149/g.69522  ORF Transcript_40149/g.69522 Transcript_40149/m.69522 type:complete len:422 (-) Transcript_40149:213-1478(-)
MDTAEPAKDGYTMSEDVVVIANEPTRFDITDPEQATAMLAYLDEHGYAVVANVGDEEHIAQGICSFWDFWETAQRRGPIKRDDLSTWKYWMANAANGILGGYSGSNHNEFSWNARTLPLVKTAFSKIWDDEEDLIVSYDACGAFRPFTHNKGWLTNGGWWHVDQNHQCGAHRQGKVTIQGLVNYYDATAETGGLCVIPGSHKHHAEVCARAPSARMKIDYVSVPRNDPILTSQQAILVCAKAGDLILWDSRTVHCNTPALAEVNYYADLLKQSAAALKEKNEKMESSTAEGKSDVTTDSIHEESISAAGPVELSTATLTIASEPAAPSAPPALLRLVSYVCMVPRSHASADILSKRKQGFLHRMPTPHYPTTECFASTEKVPFWTTRADILSLVGYTAEEIENIQQGKEPGGGSGGGCCIS